MWRRASWKPSRKWPAVTPATETAVGARYPGRASPERSPSEVEGVVEGQEKVVKEPRGFTGQYLKPLLERSKAEAAE